jgi:hypothetical protein
VPAREAGRLKDFFTAEDAESAEDKTSSFEAGRSTEERVGTNLLISVHYHGSKKTLGDMDKPDR